jgi:hypothetical protein
MVKKRNCKYYKIQYFDMVSVTYVDIQKLYETVELATANAPTDKTWRIMMVDGKNREIVSHKP